MTAAEDIKNMILDLQKDYIASIKERMTGYQRKFKNKEYKYLETEFHKLKGSGKTYYMDAISELGGIAEIFFQSKEVNETDFLTILRLLQMIIEKNHDTLTNKNDFEQQLQQLKMKFQHKK